MSDLHLGLNFDFLPPDYSWTDLSQSHQPQAAQTLDPWFQVPHSHLLVSRQRRSKSSTGPISGRTRHCSEATVSEDVNYGDGAKAVVDYTSDAELDKENITSGGAQQRRQRASQKAEMLPGAKYSSEVKGRGIKRPRLIEQGQQGTVEIIDGEGGDVRSKDEDIMRRRLEAYRAQRMRRTNPTPLAPSTIKGPFSRNATAAAHSPSPSLTQPAVKSIISSQTVSRKPAVPRQAVCKDPAPPSSHTTKQGSNRAALQQEPMTSRSTHVAQSSVSRPKAAERKQAVAASEDEEMKRLVAEHNKRFKQAPAYVARLGFRDTRKWEERTGKVYRSLSYAEREQANIEIKAMATAQAGSGQAAKDGLP